MATNDKTVTRIIEEVQRDMCNSRCMYPRIWNEEKEGMELCDSEHCQNCPLNRL